MGPEQRLWRNRKLVHPRPRHLALLAQVLVAPVLLNRNHKRPPLSSAVRDRIRSPRNPPLSAAIRLANQRVLEAALEFPNLPLQLDRELYCSFLYCLIMNSCT